VLVTYESGINWGWYSVVELCVDSCGRCYANVLMHDRAHKYEDRGCSPLRVTDDARVTLVELEGPSRYVVYVDVSYRRMPDDDKFVGVRLPVGNPCCSYPETRDSAGDFIRPNVWYKVWECADGQWQVSTTCHGHAIAPSTSYLRRYLASQKYRVLPNGQVPAEPVLASPSHLVL